MTELWCNPSFGWLQLAGGLAVADPHGVFVPSVDVPVVTVVVCTDSRAHEKANAATTTALKTSCTSIWPCATTVPVVVPEEVEVAGLVVVVVVVVVVVDELTVLVVVEGAVAAAVVLAAVVGTATGVLGELPPTVTGGTTNRANASIRCTVK